MVDTLKLLFWPPTCSECDGAAFEAVATVDKMPLSVGPSAMGLLYNGGQVVKVLEWGIVCATCGHELELELDGRYEVGGDLVVLAEHVRD